MTGSVLRGTSSTTRTMDEREMAALRPAVAAPKRPRKPPVKREVTNGIVCFCGERFAESQALEFMIHLRAEVGADLAVLQRRREYHSDYYRERRKDPEYRARESEQQRERRKDPGYRARQRESNRASRRERMKDPEYRARQNELARRRKAKRAAATHDPSTELSTE